MDWVYLSPHLDDVALSCGGLISQQTGTGEKVEIWTICAGDPPPGALSPFAEELHARWQTGREATASRRQEDLASCKRLSASCRHLPVPDCIYRRAGLDYWNPGMPVDLPTPNNDTDFLYPDREAIFGALHPLETGLAPQLTGQLALWLGEWLPDLSAPDLSAPDLSAPDLSAPDLSGPDLSRLENPALVCPMGLGGHVDHQLTRLAAEIMDRPMWYYADYPYAVQPGTQIAALEANGWQTQQFQLSPPAIEAWIQAVAAHRSQISTFWPDLQAMQAAIKAYYDLIGGAILWKRA